jgi:hypothetical protein
MPAKSRLDSGLRCKPVIPIGLAPRLPHQGGSFRIGSQIFSGFVQAHTVKKEIHVKSLLFLFKPISYVTRSAAFMQSAG